MQMHSHTAKNNTCLPSTAGVQVMKNIGKCCHHGQKLWHHGVMRHYREICNQLKSYKICTYVPPQNSTDVEEPPGPSGSVNSSSTGIPMETTRTGSGYTYKDDILSTKWAVSQPSITVRWHQLPILLTWQHLMNETLLSCIIFQCSSTALPEPLGPTG